MRKLRSRILIGGAVAVLAGAAAFAATSAADATTTAKTAALTTAAKTGTSLTIRAHKATIAAGRRDVIGGKLTKAGNAPVDRRVVELYRYDGKQKKWVPVQVRLTRKAGGVRFVVRPLVTAEYELVYHGNATLAASHSAPVTVTVTR